VRTFTIMLEESEGNNIEGDPMTTTYATSTKLSPAQIREIRRRVGNGGCALRWRDPTLFAEAFLMRQSIFCLLQARKIGMSPEEFESRI
jgi:hypothetical protein